MKQILEIFRTPTALELAQRELAQAQREFLEAMTGMEYAKRIAEYNTDRIKRLTNYLTSQDAK